jgi:hypothetical protein
LIRSTASLQTVVEDSTAAGPDPALSANIYCAGRLDEVIERLLAPCWEEIRRDGALAGCYLWVLRYGRGGEHLKARLHGPEGCQALFRERLDAAQKRYFQSLGPATSGGPPASGSAAPPIDAEDAAGHPDRTLLWTTYARSPLSLGGPPFLDDERYLSLLTRCLGRGTEILLLRLRSGEQGGPRFPLQRRLLLQAIVAGLAALPLPTPDRTRYLLYHRDGLLRHLRRRKTQTLEPGAVEDGPRAMARALGRFDAESERLGAERGAWSELMHRRWQSNAAPWDGDFAAWGRALRDLFDYLDPRCAALGQPLDPFAEHPVFPLLFKAFHGFANQAGLSHLNEAFLHHFLAGLTPGGATLQRPVQLVPAL